jgi:manganese transport protein
MIDRQAERLRGHGRLLRQVIGYLGPGFLVTVGFIDPGNWATNVAAGADYGYTLLWVVVLGTGILILWQHMSAHLGIVTGKCLAEAVRDYTHPWARAIYGITAMAAICATALAELLGAAIGLYALFGIPIAAGAALAAVVSGGAIVLQRYSTLEKVIVGFVGVIGLCYLAELHLIRPAPDWGAIAHNLILPHLNPMSTLVAIAVLGAIVMPHNIYLHSEIIQNREWKGRSEPETRRLLRFEFVDTLLAMLVGLAINAAMIIVAASVFHSRGQHVDDLIQAEATLRPLAGNLASVIFGVGLLLAGIASSMTAALAAGVTFTGYIGKETRVESGWFRLGVVGTLLTAYLLILMVSDTFQALIISQVCLSIQLPLTMLPLLLLTSSRRVMGVYANKWLETGMMILTGLAVVVLNVLLVVALVNGSS